MILVLFDDVWVQKVFAEIILLLSNGGSFLSSLLVWRYVWPFGHRSVDDIAGNTILSGVKKFI